MRKCIDFGDGQRFVGKRRRLWPSAERRSVIFFESSIREPVIREEVFIGIEEEEGGSSPGPTVGRRCGCVKEDAGETPAVRGGGR